MTAQHNRLRFDVETSRVLEILSKEIYDSPHALLRENVQNAYDAVLMRSAHEGTDLRSRSIRITLRGRQLRIEDDGIGMSEQVLSDNFWKAGSSGKHTALAGRAGVIGTFGIGAMANFGVCTSLVVTTRDLRGACTLISRARRDQLRIAEECIDIERLSNGRNPGTTIEVELESNSRLTPTQVRDYLATYVRFLPVRVTLNDTLLSQQSFEAVYAKRAEKYDHLASTRLGGGEYTATVDLSINSASQVFVRLQNIAIGGTGVSGEALFVQGGGRTMGFRNYFGLAPIPLSSNYQLGGAVNLDILHPTAGREALSRASVLHVAGLLESLEECLTQQLAQTPHADRNASFQQYIASRGLTDLAGMVTVRALPADEDIPLSDVSARRSGRRRLIYSGQDATVIQRFATEQSELFHVSQRNPRRKIQRRYLRSLGIEEVPDEIRVETVPSTDLAIDLAMVLLRLHRILVDDYLLTNGELALATISHGVQVYVETTGDMVRIALNQANPSLKTLLQSYETARDVFEGLAKDFVREHLYRHIRDYIPSSTRQGRDTLLKRLRQNKELFRYEEQDLGNMEAVLADYLSGKTTLGEVLRSSAGYRSSGQRQRVTSEHVGAVENEIPDIVQGHESIDLQLDGSEPLPPITRTDVATDKKVLLVGADYSQLNDFRLFLSLSDRLYRLEGDFLRHPHTTRIIWGAHRVIYVFSDPTASLSLYYDIELLEPLATPDTGGRMVPTTTIVTDKKMFAPVPRELSPAFAITEGERSFFVRFDTIP